MINLSGELCDKLILWFFHCQAGNDTARLAMISTFKQLEKLEKEMMQVFFEVCVYSRGLKQFQG